MIEASERISVSFISQARLRTSSLSSLCKTIQYNYNIFAIQVDFIYIIFIHIYLFHFFSFFYLQDWQEGPAKSYIPLSLIAHIFPAHLSRDLLYMLAKKFLIMEK